MTYDALGRRLSKNHLGRQTCYQWDGDVVLHHWDVAADVPQRKLSVPESSRARALQSTKENLRNAYGEGDAFNERWAEVLSADEGFERLHAELRHRETHGEPKAPEVDATVVTWLHEPDGFAPLARLTAADATSVVCDHLGAPLAALGDDGTPLLSMTLDASGTATITAEDPTHADLLPHRFPGQWHDPETGLHYNRFRHYDPDSGQYLSRDPIGLRGGLAAMAYVRDPSGWVDPLGLTGKPTAGADCAGGSAAEGGGPELDWDAVVPKKGKYKGQTRRDHVRLHNKDNPAKPEHGVFYDDAVSTIDEAWARAQAQGLKPDAQGVLSVPMGRDVGVAGGTAGSEAFVPLSDVTIIVRPGTNQIITGYPSL